MARTALAARSLETIHFGPEYCGHGEWGDGNEGTGDEASRRRERSEQLMADVTRAMEKAQEAVARIAPKAGAATTETGEALMRMWPISTRVNKPENDDPSIVEPIELAPDAA